MKLFDARYWDQRYKNENTGWDIGKISTPLKTYIDQLEDKSIRILIPGAGSAYEAEYLYANGFINTHIIDVSKTAIEKFKSRCPSFPRNQVFNINFFEHLGQYDLILEQTFFCALSPSLRENYVTQMGALLRPKGKLVGVLFKNRFPFEGPPFGGDQDEYHALFKKTFEIEILEDCYNSISPRMGNELFIMLTKADSHGK